VLGTPAREHAGQGSPALAQLRRVEGRVPAQGLAQ
jgi:hypothetical protein